MLFAASSAVYGSDWAHNAINLTHEYGDGSGVKVGVLDGPVRCSHVELAGRCTNIYYDGEYDNIEKSIDANSYPSIFDDSVQVIDIMIIPINFHLLSEIFLLFQLNLNFY